MNWPLFCLWCALGSSLAVNVILIHYAGQQRARAMKLHLIALAHREMLEIVKAEILRREPVEAAQARARAQARRRQQNEG